MVGPGMAGGHLVSGLALVAGTQLGVGCSHTQDFRALHADQLLLMDYCGMTLV